MSKITTPSITPLIWQETNLEEIASVFARDGIVAVRNMLSAAVVDRADQVARRLLKELDDRPWGAGEEYCTRFDIWTKVFGGLEDPEVIELFDNPAVDAVTKCLAGPESTTESIGSWVTPHGCGQAWHQDSWSDAPALFILNRIVFTRDYDVSQGQLLAVPGSHRRGDLPAGGPYEPLPGQVALTPLANTAVFLHTRTFHCVTKNTTVQPRIQFNRRVVPHGVPSDLTSRARFRNGTWNFSTQAPW